MPGLKTLARASLDQSSLGNLLVEDGTVSPGELSELLYEFRKLSKNGLLGQFLIEKGVITKEKLQMLLIRQSAARSGGAKARHVTQAMELANKTSRKMLSELDDFIEEVHNLATKTSVGEVK